MTRRRKRRILFPDRAMRAMREWARGITGRPSGMTDEYWYCICVLVGAVRAHFGSKVVVPAVLETAIHDATQRMFWELNAAAPSRKPLRIWRKRGRRA